MMPLGLRLWPLAKGSLSGSSNSTVALVVGGWRRLLDGERLADDRRSVGCEPISASELTGGCAACALATLRTWRRKSSTLGCGGGRLASKWSSSSSVSSAGAVANCTRRPDDGVGPGDAGAEAASAWDAVRPVLGLSGGGGSACEKDRIEGARGMAEEIRGDNGGGGGGGIATISMAGADGG